MSHEKLNNRGNGNAHWQWPPIHKEGRLPGAIVFGIGLALQFFPPWGYLGWPLLVLGFCIWAFFRDPSRVVPQTEGAVIAPADGLVTLIDEVDPPEELVSESASEVPGLPPEKVTRIAIFMSVFDVHINRAPMGGTARRIVYIPGRFMNASADKASEENERQHILLEQRDGTLIGFTQIAGLVARRIVPFIKVGDTVATGQRIGLIRFGSRVDVYLPAGTSSRIVLGQRVIAGETVLAELGMQQSIEGIAQ